MQLRLALKKPSNMAKSKQTQTEAQITPENDNNFLFAIGTPEGDLLVKVGPDGNIMYIKEGSTLQEAALVFWNAFEGYLPISQEEISKYPNDAELGLYIRNRMANKLASK